MWNIPTGWNDQNIHFIIWHTTSVIHAVHIHSASYTDQSSENSEIWPESVFDFGKDTELVQLQSYMTSRTVSNLDEISWLKLNFVLIWHQVQDTGWSYWFVLLIYDDDYFDECWIAFDFIKIKSWNVIASQTLIGVLFVCDVCILQFKLCSLNAMAISLFLIGFQLSSEVVFMRMCLRLCTISD